MLFLTIAMVASLDAASAAAAETDKSNDEQGYTYLDFDFTAPQM